MTGAAFMKLGLAPTTCATVPAMFPRLPVAAVHQPRDQSVPSMPGTASARALTGPGGVAGVAPARASRDPARLRTRVRAQGLGIIAAWPCGCRAGCAGVALRPVSRRLEIAAARWPASERLAVLAFAVRRAAGPVDGLDAFARELLGPARARQPRRLRRLIELAYQAGLRDVAAGALARVPADTPSTRSSRPAPTSRSRRAATAMRSPTAAGPTGRDPAFVVPDCTRDVAPDRARTGVDCLRSGPRAPACARCADGAVRGHVLHVVSVALPHRLAGYTVRTQQSSSRARSRAGLDAQVAGPEPASRSGSGGAPGIADRVGPVVYNRVEPLPSDGPAGPR